MNGKYKALDIANLYIQLANDMPNDSIDNLKLNKLCYYAQAWSLARLGYPLFDETIEAWKYGPLIRSVYYTFNVCGKNPIEEPSYHFDESNLTSDELSLVTDVYITYGKYTSGALIDKTHTQGSPYDLVYVEDQNQPIPEELMKSYFAKSNELESMRLNLSPDKVISYV